MLLCIRYSYQNKLSVLNFRGQLLFDGASLGFFQAILLQKGTKFNSSKRLIIFIQTCLPTCSTSTTQRTRNIKRMKCFTNKTSIFLHLFSWTFNYIRCTALPSFPSSLVWVLYDIQCFFFYLQRGTKAQYKWHDDSFSNYHYTITTKERSSCIIGFPCKRARDNQFTFYLLDLYLLLNELIIK